MKKVLYSQLSAEQLEQANSTFHGVRADDGFRYVVAPDGEVIGREPITEQAGEAHGGNAVEKLVRIEAGGLETYIRPSSVQAIKPRMFGSDVYLTNAGGGKAEKVFVQLDPDSVAMLLGLA
jgi:hypothetical protein